MDHARHAIKKRFQHKLLHDVRKHRRPSCVGCGRCVGMCFGGMERHMKCSIGGHCHMDDKLVCVDGPVFSRRQLLGLNIEELQP